MLLSVCEATVTLAQEVLDIIINLLTSAETKWFASLGYISPLNGNFQFKCGQICCEDGLFQQEFDQINYQLFLCKAVRVKSTACKLEIFF